jgi:prepilin-type N-terminal cleavage/methylation domain-containing protein
MFPQFHEPKPMKSIRTLAFTLIELLVVISIIGLLAALAIPAVASALVKGQLTGTLNNARQLHLATFNINLENESVGLPGAWPGTNAGVSFPVWRDYLTNVLTESELRKMFSAPRVSVTNALNATMAQTAFNVYQVGNTEDSGAIFISTRNWLATQPEDAPLPTAIPYGDKGTVIMRRGGDGAVLAQRLITNTNAVGVSTNQPPLATAQ